MKKPFARLTVFMFLGTLGQATAQDWPQFLGPNRDGTCQTSALAEVWPEKPSWKRELGSGWSGPVVKGHRLIAFDRRDDKERVACLNATNGEPFWTTEYPTRYRDDFGFDDGPRATPAIDRDRVYTSGADGMLSCWNLNSGEAVWKVDTRKEYNSRKGFFGRACSPLVEGDLLIVHVGGEQGAGVVAFEVASGKERWRATADEASYSSPVAATFDNQRFALVLTRRGLVCLNPANGNVQFEYPFRPAIDASVTAAVPLVIGHSIFISASYQAGAVLLEFDPAKPKVVWKKDGVLSNHYATAVPRDGFLYGFDGRQEEGCHLRCVELRTGKVRWSEDGFGAGTLLAANDQLLILTEKGELVGARASPESFKVDQRVQILGFGTRAHAGLANGWFYARDKKQLVCVDLRKKP